MVTRGRIARLKARILIIEDKPMKRRKHFVGLLFLVIFTIVCITPLTKTAKAYSTTGVIGRPGQVTVSRIIGSHEALYVGTWQPVWTPKVSDAGTLAYRSPASTGAQIVANSYEVYRRDNVGQSWSHVYTSMTGFNTIWQGASSVRMPKLYTVPNPRRIGYFMVVQRIYWFTAAGIHLGSREIVMNWNSDYLCQTRFTCQVLGGSIYIGSAN